MPSLTMHSASKTRTKKAASKKRKSLSTSSSSNHHNQHNNQQPPNTTNYNTNGYNNNNNNNTTTYSNGKHTPNGHNNNNNNNILNGEALTQNAEFLGNRSPFYETVSRHIVMPVCQKQLINFQFNLPLNFVSDIQNGQKKTKKSRKKKRKNTTDKPIQRLLQIRLFNLATNKHVEWQPYIEQDRHKNQSEDGFRLKINKNNIKMPPIIGNDQKKKKKLGTKSKGFRFMQPLDISKYASNTMSFEISCHKPVFYGAASIEIVNLLTVDEIAARVISRSELALSLHQVTHKCKICGICDNLSRCSRCKATWYCGLKHQQMDWNVHHLGCQPFDTLNGLKLKNKKPHNDNGDEDEVICNAMKVSIKDPLTLCRMSVAVRGINCYHPQCVDLKTYLNYCHNTKVWQCPICIGPLLYSDLVVDKSMNKIIKEIPNDIDQVRLNPDDYSYKVITLQEQQECDGFILKEERNNSNNKKNRKRKLVEQNGQPKGKKRKMNDIQIIVLD